MAEKGSDVVINIELLEQKIRESGYQQRFIAKKLGITYQAFLNKKKGKTAFTGPEIAVLCKLLSLSDRDRHKIFLF